MESPLFYKELRENLALFNFPNIYQFEFIVPNEKAKIEQFKSFFEADFDISITTLQNADFVQIVIKTVVISSNEVIITYKELLKIEGVSVPE